MDEKPKIVKVEREGLECTRCGHVWVPNDITKPPKSCPNRKCNSPYWNRERRKPKEAGKGEQNV